MKNRFASRQDFLYLQLPMISYVLTEDFSSINSLIDSFSAFEVDLIDRSDNKAKFKLRGSESRYDVGIYPFVDHAPEYFPGIHAKYCLTFGILSITYSRKNKVVLNEIQVALQRVVGKLFFFLESQLNAKLILENEFHAVYQLGKDYISIEYVVAEFSSMYQIYLSIYKNQRN
jgi:hypothetical protein